ncbi:hypothetical protein [Bifidobacterium choloepi]|nr:hypothetical protein [Bifidobacterium choloepi]
MGMLIAVVFGTVVAPVALYGVIRFALKFLAGEWEPRSRRTGAEDVAD